MRVGTTYHSLVLFFFFFIKGSDNLAFYFDKSNEDLTVDHGQRANILTNVTTKVQRFEENPESMLFFAEPEESTIEHILNIPEDVFHSLRTFGPLNFGAILIGNSSTVMRVMRTYMKAQTVLAQIGGIINAIMVISRFLQNFLVK